MRKPLFEDFKAISAEEWRDQIVKDLKGKPYESLIKETLEGITVKPDYTSSDSAGVEGVPGEPPYFRGLKREPASWTIVEAYAAETNNKELLEALQAGANGLSLPFTSAVINDGLKGVEVPYIQLFFNHSADTSLVVDFFKWIESKGWNPLEISGSLGFDPLGESALKGEWTDPSSEMVNSLFNLSKQYDAFQKLRFFNVRGNNYAEAGASASTELAVALAQAHEYLLSGLRAGLAVDDITQRIQFTFGVGTDYFLEITKFRVARRLCAQIVKQYEPKASCSQATYIVAQTNARQYAAADVYTNMIRATTMSMAGGLGGADAVHTLPFDHHYSEKKSFNKRIARNVNLLLQEESYLHRVLDPSGGSYFLDTMAEEFADKTWAFFQEIESAGGFVKALESNIIQTKIEAEAAQEELLLQEGKRVMVGVNKFPNAKDDLATAHFSSPVDGKAFKALQLKRVSESFEKK